MHKALLIYEMVHGRSAWYSLSQKVLWANLKRADVSELRFPLRRLSGQAKEMILSLLQREPAERLGSGGGGWT